MGAVGRNIKDLSADAGLGPEVQIRVELAVCEAINNAIVHGLKDIENADVVITAEISPGQLEVLVQDEGSPIPQSVLGGMSQQNLDRELSSEVAELPVSGWGLDMIDALCAEWNFHSTEGINTFRLVFR